MSAEGAPERKTCRVSSDLVRRRRWLAEWLAGGGAQKMAAMRDRFEQQILRQVELTRVNSGQVARTPNTSNIIFECIEGEALVIALDLKGISVSTGAACSSGAVEPSHVLTAMGLTSGEARASIRFSLGKQTSEEDLAFVLDQLPATVAKLRELSPVWNRTGLDLLVPSLEKFFCESA